VKYTLRSRNAPGEQHLSPGPAAYTPDYMKTRVSIPASTMHIRPKDAVPDQTAGYVQLASTLGGPKWAIGGRDDLEVLPL
jgi:hypothetical protein